ncbi:MAG: sulfatase-like hydrolase/transferase [Phycisphaerae bacterium]|nr:sulfatase-like hydrolase/transferase [Phycisphaerae bacterium]
MILLMASAGCDRKSGNSGGDASQGTNAVSPSSTGTSTSGTPTRVTTQSAPVASSQSSEPISLPPDAPSNIVLITLDTTRADRIGCYGHAGAMTPALDALALEGARFSRAISSAPLTFPSHASLFSGVHPPVHGCRVNATDSIRDSIPLLTDALRARGYATAAFVSAFVLHHRFGLNRGFDVYDDGLNESHDFGSHGERRGDLTCDAAIKWLSNRKPGPFFIWLHLFDPHEPYAAPPPFNEMSDAYDGEIAFADSQVARVVEALSRAEHWDNSLVVIIGDHGESLMEHGEPTHGLLLHDSTLRVPLIVRWPRRVPKGRVIDASVELVDIFPTVADFIGMEPLERCSGRSLRSTWETDESWSDRLIYSETQYPWRSYGWAPMTSLVRGNWRYVEAPIRELYDRETDPGETVNLASKRADLADEFRELLVQMTSRFVAIETNAVLPDATSRGMLESLGYVGASATASDPTGRERDPKQMLETYLRYVTAQKMLKSGRINEAMPILESVVKDSPESDELYVSLGSSYLTLGRPADAERALAMSLRTRADDPYKLWMLGEALQRQDKLEAALKCFSRTAELLPEMADAQRSIAMVHWKRRDFAAAYEPFRRYTELKPQAAAGWIDLGNVCAALGRTSEAISAYEKSLVIDPANLMARQAYIQALIGSGRKLDAITAMKGALAANPGENSMKTPLVWMAATTEGVDAQTLHECVKLGESQAQANPGDARTLDALAAIYAAVGRFEDALATARQALSAAEAMGDKDLTARIGFRAKLYEARKPFRSQ